MAISTTKVQIFQKDFLIKVEKIQDDSLDSIPSLSPLVKIQIIGEKVYPNK